MANKIPESEAGCWLDGHMGWHNTYRAIERAQEWGFDIDADDEAYIQKWKLWRGGDMTAAEEASFEENGSPDFMNGQGGLVEKATEYLDSLAPEGMAFNWDCGELALLCLCQIEGSEENEALGYNKNQCARCDARDGK